MATWCEEPTHWKRPWFGERLRAGGDEGDRDEMGGWYHWFSGHEFEQTLGDTEGQGSLGVLQSMGSQIVGYNLLTELQQ